MLRWLVSVFVAALVLPSAAMPASRELGERVRAVMQKTRAHGIAIAVIDGGQVRSVAGFGIRNAKGDPLTADTVMYGASLTKAVFAYGIMKLVDDGRLDLDTPIAALLPEPLPEYSAYKSLAGDPRWKSITPRMALAFVEPDHKLHIHFDPGSRYAYSGEGFLLLQFALERGLGLDIKEFTDGYLQKLGLARTSFQWRDSFDRNLADGWNDQDKVVPHDRRSHIRAPGSMDTTITDMAKFAAALVSGKGLSSAALAELERPQLAITAAHQFPTFLPELPPSQRRADLRAGLGVVTFKGPQGEGFYKGGHDAQTANTMVCLVKKERCVVILANDVRAEAGFGELVSFILGETGVPYGWEYGEGAGKSNP